MRRIILVAIVALSTINVFAADRGKYDQWGDSPASYFMTEDERTEWERVRSEAEAEKFVAAFLARRAPGFAAEVTKRAAMADKYMTIGKLPGSKTLRGKVIVLFGPPAAMNVSDRTDTKSKRDNPAIAGALSNAGAAVIPPSGGRGGDAPSGTGGTLTTALAIRTFAISYEGDAAKKTGQQNVTFTIEADAATGTDRFVSRNAKKEAEELFERMARASIVAP